MGHSTSSKQGPGNYFSQAHGTSIESYITSLGVQRPSLVGSSPFLRGAWGAVDCGGNMVGWSWRGRWEGAGARGMELGMVGGDQRLGRELARGGGASSGNLCKFYWGGVFLTAVIFGALALMGYDYVS